MKCKNCLKKMNVTYPFGMKGHGRIAHMCKLEDVEKRKTLNRISREAITKASAMLKVKK